MPWSRTLQTFLAWKQTCIACKVSSTHVPQRLQVGLSMIVLLHSKLLVFILSWAICHSTNEPRTRPSNLHRCFHWNLFCSLGVKDKISCAKLVMSLPLADGSHQGFSTPCKDDSIHIPWDNSFSRTLITCPIIDIGLLLPQQFPVTYQSYLFEIILVHSAPGLDSHLHASFSTSTWPTSFKVLIPNPPWSISWHTTDHASRCIEHLSYVSPRRKSQFIFPSMPQSMLVVHMCLLCSSVSPCIPPWLGSGGMLYITSCAF